SRAHPPPHSFPTRRSSDLATEIFRRRKFGHSTDSVLRQQAAPFSAVYQHAMFGKRLFHFDRLIAARNHIGAFALFAMDDGRDYRSEEHTSELQSRSDLVCR